MPYSSGFVIAVYAEIRYSPFLKAANAVRNISDRIVIRKIAVEVDVVTPEPELVGNTTPFGERFFDMTVLFIRKITI